MTEAVKQEISTVANSTRVILTLFIGETYVEAGFFDQDYINDLKNKPQSKKKSSIQ